MKNIRLEIKWAVIFMAMQLLWVLLEYMIGLHHEHINKHPIYTNFILLPSIGIYLLAFLDKRKNFYNGEMTYKQGFLTGLILTLFITILAPLLQYIISTTISPNYFSNTIDYAVENNKMTQQEANDYFNLQNYIIQILIATPIMGILTTVILAIFARKKIFKNGVQN